MKSLYPQAVDIAKSVTRLDSETEAVKSFRRLINSPSMYFNEAPFPKNESDERAHRKCNSERGKVRFKHKAQQILSGQGQGSRASRVR